MLNEDVSQISTTTTATTKDGYVAAVKASLPDIRKAEQMTGTKVEPTVTNPRNDVGKDSPTFIATGVDITSAAENVPPSVYQQGMNVKFTTDAVSEMRFFTKKMVEEARIDSMRKTGRIMTKGELKNSVK